MTDVKTYLFRRRIDGTEYGFDIPCRDLAEARNIATANLWRVDGEHVLTIGVPCGDFTTQLRRWWRSQFGGGVQ